MATLNVSRPSTLQRVRSTARFIASLWLPVIIILGWYQVSKGSTSIVNPSLSNIMKVFCDDWLPGPHSLLRSQLLPTVANLLAGLLIAIVVGLVFGVIVGSSRLLLIALRPSLELARACPAVVFFPMVFIFFGLSAWGKVTIVAYAVFWPVLLNTIAGVRSVDPLVRDMARSYRLSRRQTIFNVVLRSASPQIMAGIRVATAVAVTMAVASEYYASDHGVGYYVFNSQQVFAARDTWSGTILLGLLGYLLSLLSRGAEHIVLRWHTNMRHAMSDGSQAH